MTVGIRAPQSDSNVGCTNSSLSFLRDVLYLVTYFSGHETLLAKHFVRHYTRVIGVKLQHMHFFIDRGQGLESTESTLQMLRAEGIPTANAEVVPDANFTDKLKLATVNRHISQLPKDAYAIHPDIDEFFSYPCDMERRVRLPDAPSHIWCTLMADRMAANGKVLPIQPEPDLASQFPLPCYMRAHLRGSISFFKVALFRAHGASGSNRTFETPHRLRRMWGKHGSCALLPQTPERGQLAHYSMTTDSLEFLRRKMNIFRNSAQLLQDYSRQATFLKAHLPDTPHDARSHRWCTLEKGLFSPERNLTLTNHATVPVQTF